MLRKQRMDLTPRGILMVRSVILLLAALMGKAVELHVLPHGRKRINRRDLNGQKAQMIVELHVGCSLPTTN